LVGKVKRRKAPFGDARRVCGKEDKRTVGEGRVGERYGVERDLVLLLALSRRDFDPNFFNLDLLLLEEGDEEELLLVLAMDLDEALERDDAEEVGLGEVGGEGGLSGRKGGGEGILAGEVDGKGESDGVDANNLRKGRKEAKGAPRRTLSQSVELSPRSRWKFSV
jgi:hypothetical protein